MLDYIIDDNDVADKSTWNGVIHKGASCYFDNIIDFENYIIGLNKDIVYYYLIEHNKQENGIIEKHYHFIVCFSKKTTLKKVKDIFVGSHIEETGNKQASIQYLVHRTAKAKSQLKEEYRYSDIITNDVKAREKFLQLDLQIEQNGKGTILQDTGEIYAILTDKALQEDYILPLADLIKKYGSKQVKTKLILINQLKKESSINLYDSLKEQVDRLTEMLVQLQEDNDKLKEDLKKEKEITDKTLPW